MDPIINPDIILSTHETILVKTQDDLPASQEYTLPNWHLDHQYRATAWAYLHREDGGNTVELQGKHYQLDSASKQV